MNVLHQKLIRKNYIKFSTDLEDVVQHVASSLYSKGTITKFMKDNILKPSLTNLDKAYALLDLIPKRGPRAFDDFYDSVKEAGLYELADILRPDKAPHDSLPPSYSSLPDPELHLESHGGSESEEEALPKIWPPPTSSQTMSTSVVVKTATKTDTEAEKRRADRYRRKYEKHLTNDQVYPMKHKIRGLAAIFNNERFQNLDFRDGSCFDSHPLNKLFTDLGFKVLQFINKTAEGMREKLNELRQEDIKATNDCLVIVVMSHGHEGVVFGTDGKYVNGKPENYLEIQKLTSMFSDVGHLHGKPKLFFIQACQGTQKDSGVIPGAGGDTPISSHGTPDLTNLSMYPNSSGRVGSSNDSGNANNLSGAFSEGSDRLDLANSTIEDSLGFTLKQNPPKVKQDETDSSADKVASTADVFVGVSTPPSYLSWRRPDFGTWYIQAIIEIFSKFAYRDHLLDLMIKVNSLLQRAETSKGYKQVSIFTQTLSKKVYFFPGFHEQN